MEIWRVIQKANQLNLWGTSRGKLGEIQGTNQEASQRTIHSTIQRANQGTGTERSNTGLKMQVDITGKAVADPGAKEIMCLAPFAPAALLLSVLTVLLFTRRRNGGSRVQKGKQIPGGGYEVFMLG